jgi:hypothetical protein
MRVLVGGQRRSVPSAQTYKVKGMAAFLLVFKTTRVRIHADNMATLGDGETDYRIAVTTRHDADADGVTMFTGYVTDDYVRDHCSQEPITDIPAVARDKFLRAVLDAQNLYIPRFVTTRESKEELDAIATRA